MIVRRRALIDDPLTAHKVERPTRYIEYSILMGIWLASVCARSAQEKAVRCCGRI